MTRFIKALIVSVLMLFLFPGGLKAQDQHKFFYYPEYNIYYDISSEQYISNNDGTWIKSETLPISFSITNETKKVIIYHYDKYVWNANNEHRSLFAAKKITPGTKRFMESVK